MDFKKMLLDLADAQAKKMQDEAMGFLASDEFAEEIASKINEKEFNRDLLISKIMLYFQQKNIKFKLEDLNSIENKQLVNTLSMICPF